jgi:nucleoside-diphosphate-sugar epimerase
VERLVASGRAVVGVDSFSDSYDVRLKEANASALARLGVPVLRLDLSVDDLEPALEDVDEVVHLAALAGLGGRKASDYVRHNEVGTRRLVEALCAPGVRRRLRLVVNVATSSVYGRRAITDETTPLEPISAYGASKLAAERTVMDAGDGAGLPVCSLRPFSVYGPRERPEKLVPRLLDAAEHGTPFTLFAGSADHRRSFTYVTDVADAILAALDRAEAARGEVFNVGHPRSHTTREVIELVEQVTGRPVRVTAAPARPGDLFETRALVGKAREVLGVVPTTDLEDGIRLQASWAAGVRPVSGGCVLRPTPGPVLRDS